MKPSMPKKVELDEAGKAMASITGNGVKDPLCSMTVDPNATSHRHTCQGHSYSIFALRAAKANLLLTQ